MIFGEVNGSGDICTNICRKHDGYREAGNYPAYQPKRLEQALAYILEDEKVEVTPKRVVMRKALLDETERRNWEKQQSKR